MYNINSEFGAIRSNKRKDDKFGLRERKRSSSQGQLESDRFSNVSDIPTDDKPSRFMNPRDSNMNTIKQLD